MKRSKILDARCTAHGKRSTELFAIHTVYRLPSTVFRLPFSVYRLPSTVCRLPSTVRRSYRFSCRKKPQNQVGYIYRYSPIFVVLLKNNTPRNLNVLELAQTNTDLLQTHTKVKQGGLDVARMHVLIQPGALDFFP